MVTFSISVKRHKSHCVSVTFVQYLFICSIDFCSISFKNPFLSIQKGNNSSPEMDQSTCFVCRKSTNYFHKNLWTLKTKPSETHIFTTKTLIINEESPFVRSLDNAATLRFKCVDKINEYDEATLKIHQIERELNEMHHQINSTSNPVTSNVINKHVDCEYTGHGNDDDSDSDYSNYSLISLDKTG